MRAAFLASRNKPSVDKQLFQNSSGARAGRRRAGGGGRRAQAQDRQAEAAREAQLRGPHAFPLQRLLAAYRALRRADASGHEWRPLGADAAPSRGEQRPPQQGAAGTNRRRGAASGSTIASAPSSSAAGVEAPDGRRLLDQDSAGLLMALSGLVSARLLAVVGEDVLEAPRYQCLVPEEVVHVLAVELGITLSSFLKYV